VSGSNLGQNVPYSDKRFSSFYNVPSVKTLYLAADASPDILNNHLFTVTGTSSAAHSQLETQTVNKLLSTLQLLSYHREMENQYNIHADAMLYK
jgi:hypothetical protein